MLELDVNGERRIFRGDGLSRLLDVLPADFLLSGTKAVCREGFCGACTVQIDGTPTMSCLVPVALLEGRTITTIEGLGIHGDLTPIQQAFEDHDVVQCGMCFPGMVMTLGAFLSRRPGASRDEIKEAMVGNACRCTGYERIVDAVLSLSTQTGSVP